MSSTIQVVSMTANIAENRDSSLWRRRVEWAKKGAEEYMEQIKKTGWAYWTRDNNGSWKRITEKENKDSWDRIMADSTLDKLLTQCCDETGCDQRLWSWKKGEEIPEELKKSLASGKIKLVTLEESQTPQPPMQLRTLWSGNEEPDRSLSPNPNKLKELEVSRLSRKVFVDLINLIGVEQ